MIKVDPVENADVSEDIDWAAVERAAWEAAHKLMRRRGLPKGQNLVGTSQAAADAAQAELARQLDNLR